jgi:very-short-patch-repair endonuclease
MERRIPPASPHMIARGRQLRRKLSFPERLLWGRLRNGRCGGVKFRRQQPVGPYVVDFFCADARLVIELDGMSHEGQAEGDEIRHRYLEAQVFRVLRFSNKTLLKDMKGVVKAIAYAAGVEEF